MVPKAKSFVDAVLFAFKKIDSEITEDALEHDFSPRLARYFCEEVLGYGSGEIHFERNRTDVTMLDENKSRAVLIETKRPREDLSAEKWHDQAGKYADATTRFVGLTNGYRFLLWEVTKRGRILRTDVDFKALVDSKRTSEDKLSTKETEQILFLGNIAKQQIWSEAKYAKFDEYYAAVDISEDAGFDKLIEQLKYISNDLLRQYTYSAFDEYDAGYAQHQQAKGELDEIKKQNGNNSKRAAEIAKFELKTEGKYKKYASFSGYHIWKVLSNRPDDKEEENKQIFCKESIYVLLNRLLFIRICEDKGLLKKKISNGGIERLREELSEPIVGDSEVFKQIIMFSYGGAQKIYYHFYEKDNPLDWYESGDGELDRVLNKVIWALNQFDFSKVDRDILGKLYEKYLPKDERKRLGEFYTPDAVIDYILDAAEYVPSKAIDGKDLIDPACGSGGFLVRAARRLIARYAVKFGKATPKEAMDNKRWREVCERLTPKECEEIVRGVATHIHGFDINPFAVNISEMNLLFQVIDLYSRAVKENPSFTVPRFRVYETDSLELPTEQTSLARFYGATGKSLAKDKEAVDELKRKRYDFVVGNPPYVRIQQMSSAIRKEYSESYETTQGNYDIYVPFIELGIKLLNNRGKFGYICSNQFFKRDYGRKLRQFISSAAWVEQIVNFKDAGVFKDATNYPAILIFSKEEPSSTEIIIVDRPMEDTLKEISDGKTNENVDRYSVDLRNKNYEDWVLESPKQRKIDLIFEKCKPLSELGEIVSGVQTGADKIYLGQKIESQEMYSRVGFGTEQVKIETSQIMPFILGRQVRKWMVVFGDRVAIFPYERENQRYRLPNEDEIKKKMPFLYAYLLKHKNALDKRQWYGQSAEKLHGAWYAYMYFKLDQPRAKLILAPALVNQTRFAPNNTEALFALGTAGVFGILPKGIDFHTLLGILNSEVINFAIKRISPEKRGGSFQLNSRIIGKIPIRMPQNSREQKLFEEIGELVKKAVRACKEKSTELRSIEKRIDELVYELYEIKDEERRIIERSTRTK